MRIGMHLAFAFDLFALLPGKAMVCLQASGAAMVPLFGTCRALDKQYMAGIVGTVRMGIGCLSALVATCNYIIRNPLAHPVVKNKFLPINLLCNSSFFT